MRLSLHGKKTTAGPDIEGVALMGTPSAATMGDRPSRVSPWARLDEVETGW